MNKKTAFNIIGLGAISGLRTMAALAFVSHKLSRRPGSPLQHTELRRLAEPTAATVFKLLAAGEAVGDKLPFAPNRIDPGPLAGRLAAGALVGAAVARLQDDSPGTGALLGAVSAAAATFAAFHVRRTLGEEAGVPDVLLAVGEDALVLAAGRALVAEM